MYAEGLDAAPAPLAAVRAAELPGGRAAPRRRLAVRCLHVVVKAVVHLHQPTVQYSIVQKLWYISTSLGAEWSLNFQRVFELP